MSYNSILNDSNYFHVTEGLCPDVMHDVLEGVAQYEVKELLNYLINIGVLTLMSSIEKFMISLMLMQILLTSQLSYLHFHSLIIV